jgi:hypothetical protein
MGPDQRPEEFYVEMLGVIEINTDEQIVARVAFDPDDIDAAFDELDARYLAGQAAAYSQTWSAIAAVYSAINRHEFPEFAPDWVNIDHRRGTAFAPGDLKAYAHASWADSVDASVYVQAVHRLNRVGAVVTYVAYATTAQGFEAEWREVGLSTVDGHRVNRSELFDEDDLDAALARLAELSTSAPQLENSATRARTRVCDAYNRRDVDGLLALTTDDVWIDDRRKGLRDEGAVREDAARALLEFSPPQWQQETETIAIRGSRFAVSRVKYVDTADAERPITVEYLAVTEVNDDGLMCATVLFDPDDINGAISELHARWIASGEVAHPEVIEAARQVNEIYNRHDWDAMASRESGATYVNHRLLAGDAETIGDHWSSYRTLASLVPDIRVEPAEILTHSAIGLVSNLVVKGTTAEGARIELPAITLVLFDGTRVMRMEAFDVDQRDLALTRFEELNRPT